MQQSFPSGRGFPRESTPPVIRVDHAEEEDGGQWGQESSPERRIHPTMGIAGGSLLGPMYNTNVSTTNCEKNLTTKTCLVIMVYKPRHVSGASVGINQGRAVGVGWRHTRQIKYKGIQFIFPNNNCFFFFSGVSSIKSITRGAPVLPIYLPYRLSSS